MCIIVKLESTLYESGSNFHLILPNPSAPEIFVAFL